ncbi:hypothetical protein SUGI_0633660 [Cryptomeria japonica]|nr:hypothetical protein SUGI_0633640 [Cryptomeria japonica]GLJ31575.1 hypothetical protein SUGI_0633660 [Cryptomeria japonica]
MMSFDHKTILPISGEITIGMGGIKKKFKTHAKIKDQNLPAFRAARSKAIIIPSQIIENSNTYLKARGFFVKWTGQGPTKDRIIEWWKDHWGDRISIKALLNDFFLIECRSEEFKE